MTLEQAIKNCEIQVDNKGPLLAIVTAFDKSNLYMYIQDPSCDDPRIANNVLYVPLLIFSLAGMAFKGDLAKILSICKPLPVGEQSVKRAELNWFPAYEGIEALMKPLMKKKRTTKTFTFKVGDPILN